MLCLTHIKGFRGSNVCPRIYVSLIQYLSKTFLSFLHRLKHSFLVKSTNVRIYPCILVSRTRYSSISIIRALPTFTSSAASLSDRIECRMHFVRIRPQFYISEMFSCGIRNPHENCRNAGSSLPAASIWQSGDKCSDPIAIIQFAKIATCHDEKYDPRNLRRDKSGVETSDVAHSETTRA